MATIINTPGSSDESGGAVGIIVGLLILLIVGALFFMYALPAIRNASAPQQPQQQNPGSIDVNVQLPEGGQNGGSGSGSGTGSGTPAPAPAQ